MSAFKLGFDADTVLDEINQMTKEREADASRLAILIETKESLVRDSELEEHLKDLCARILPDLDNCTCQDQEGRLRLPRPESHCRSGQRRHQGLRSATATHHWADIGMSALSCVCCRIAGA